MTYGFGLCRGFRYGEECWSARFVMTYGFGLCRGFRYGKGVGVLGLL